MMNPVVDSILKLYWTVRDGWSDIVWSRLHFTRTQEAVLAGAVLLLLAGCALLVRYYRKRIAGRVYIPLPAVFSLFGRSPWRIFRHLPAVFVLAGLVFFLIAFADPETGMVKETTTERGRRIIIILDASGSMDYEDKTATLKEEGPTPAPLADVAGPGAKAAQRTNEPGKRLRVAKQRAFFTCVAAAEYFIRMRIKKGYRDLIGLVEFGEQAYVITPFTNDYDNILMSIKLIGEPEERDNFPNKGTRIMHAMRQSIEMFRTFGFLESAGNMIVLFSDGEDTEVADGISTVDDLMADAKRQQIPVFFIRQEYEKEEGSQTEDKYWIAASRASGGNFYAGASEAAVIRALEDIDRKTAGSIRQTRFSIHQPRFAFFAAVAVCLWSLAAFCAITFRVFRRFP